MGAVERIGGEGPGVLCYTPGTRVRAFGVLLRSKRLGTRTGRLAFQKQTCRSIAIIETRMVKTEQVFLPYAITRDGKTLYKHVESNPRFLLARIIHQPEKSTGAGDFVVQMNHKTTSSQAYEASKTISSGLPDIVHIGRMGAPGRTASCQPPGASLSGWACEPLGLSIDLAGPARSGARRPIRSTCASGPG